MLPGLLQSHLGGGAIICAGHSGDGYPHRHELCLPDHDPKVQSKHPRVSQRPAPDTQQPGGVYFLAFYAFRKEEGGKTTSVLEARLVTGLAGHATTCSGAYKVTQGSCFGLNASASELPAQAAPLPPGRDHMPGGFGAMFLLVALAAVYFCRNRAKASRRRLTEGQDVEMSSTFNQF